MQRRRLSDSGRNQLAGCFQHVRKAASEGGMPALLGRHTNEGCRRANSCADRQRRQSRGDRAAAAPVHFQPRHFKARQLRKPLRQLA